MAGRKSERLRLSDVRGVYRLIGECRDLGSDPAAWRGHIARSLHTLAGGQVTLVGEAAKSADGTTPGLIYQWEHHGWITPRHGELWASYHASEGYRREPILRPIQAFGFRNGFCTRQQAVDDSAWYRSSYYNENQRACGLDEFLISFEDLPGRTRQNIVSVIRPAGRGVFRAGERRLVRLFHAELARHFGASLVTLDDPSPSGLTPRLRATLRCLLEGDSEKQVAARLGLSRATVHEYVKAVYRHFRVSSRPGLMAYFLRRTGFRLPDDRE